MSPRVKSILKDWLPPALLRLARSAGVPGAPRGIDFVGDCATWEEAQAQAGGYAAANILEKARTAVLKVKNGQAACERDTVTFDHIEYSYPLLAHLLHTAARNGNKLAVLDFGGALGSSYYQNRACLSHLDSLHWMVVEQPHFVACGTADFADGKLSFHETIEAAAAFHAPDFILLSSVLQYLERPIDILPSLAATGAPTLLVDRAPILPDVRTRIVVQHVPPSIYSASYPCRLYNEAEFISLFAPQYALADQFDANIGSTIAVEGATGRYRGYLFENTAPARPGIRSPT